MKRICTKEEGESLTPEEISYSRPRKVEFTLLDPTGMEIDRHEFYYRGPYGIRTLLIIDGHPHMFGTNGAYLGEPGEPRHDICYCGEKMKAISEPQYVCMNPYCDYYCKLRTNLPQPEQKVKTPLDVEMERLAQWLKSDEGRETIRKAQEKAEESCKAIEEAERIAPEVTKIIFGKAKKKLPEKPKVETCNHVLRKYQVHNCEIRQKAKTCKGCHYYHI